MTEESIGLDVIERVGVGGNFLSDEHTVTYMRECNPPDSIFNRNNFDNWIMKGGDDVLARAHVRVQEITEGWEEMEPVVDAGTLVRLMEMEKEAQKEIAESIII